MPDQARPLNTIPERLRYIRDFLQLTRAQVKEKYGISTDTLSAWESGKIKISQQGVEKCIEAYKSEGLVVSKDWLLWGKGTDPKFFMDLSKYVRAENDSTLEVPEIDDNLRLLKEIDFFKSLSESSIVLTVGSDDMFPLYRAGDVIGGRYRRKFKLEEFISKDCIFKTKKNQILFRRVSKVISNTRCNLSCLNSTYGIQADPVMYDVEILDIAPVIWHRRLEE